MTSCQHVIIAYGEQLGYHHGAKYQILAGWEKIYKKNNIPIRIVTDKPELFSGYPVEIMTISPVQKFDWSLNGIQHFGIKLKGLQWAMENQQAEVALLLDTDTYWTAHPRVLIEQIKPNSAVMYCNEGFVMKSSNKSISRFPEGLLFKKVQTNIGVYELSSSSRMLNSSMIGLHRQNIDALTHAHDLFRALEPMVNAHTVEQFSLSEIFRMKNYKVTFGRKLTRDWSSTGKKNYVTPLLGDFFSEYGENDFEKHLEKFAKINVKRPVTVLLKQKLGF